MHFIQKIIFNDDEGFREVGLQLVAEWDRLAWSDESHRTAPNYNVHRMIDAKHHLCKLKRTLMKKKIFGMRKIFT